MGALMGFLGLNTSPEFEESIAPSFFDKPRMDYVQRQDGTRRYCLKLVPNYLNTFLRSLLL